MHGEWFVLACVTCECSWASGCRHAGFVLSALNQIESNAGVRFCMHRFSTCQLSCNVACDTAVVVERTRTTLHHGADYDTALTTTW